MVRGEEPGILNDFVACGAMEAATTAGWLHQRLPHLTDDAASFAQGQKLPHLLQVRRLAGTISSRSIQVHLVPVRRSRPHLPLRHFSSARQHVAPRSSRNVDRRRILRPAERVGRLLLDPFVLFFIVEHLGTRGGCSRLAGGEPRLGGHRRRPKMRVVEALQPLHVAHSLDMSAPAAKAATARRNARRHVSRREGNHGVDRPIQHRPPNSDATVGINSEVGSISPQPHARAKRLEAYPGASQSLGQRCSVCTRRAPGGGREEQRVLRATKTGAKQPVPARHPQDGDVPFGGPRPEHNST